MPVTLLPLTLNAVPAKLAKLAVATEPTTLAPEIFVMPLPLPTKKVALTVPAVLTPGVVIGRLNPQVLLTLL